MEKFTLAQASIKIDSNRSAGPVWEHTAPPATVWPCLDEHIRVDVAVVGGGFCGLSACLHLARAGTDVALLEQHDPGWGASGRNGGQVIPGLKLDPKELLTLYGEKKGERLVSLTGSAPDLVFELIAEYGIECDARRSGWIQLATGPRGLAEIRSRVEQWQSRAVDIESLDAAQISTISGAEGYVGGLHDRRGGKLNPLAYARGLALAAQSNGARIFAQSPMLALRRKEGAWHVSSNSGQIIADNVLLCTNAYTDNCWPKLNKTIIPFVSGAIATEPLPDEIRSTILPGGQAAADNARLLSWFGLDGAGRLIFGGRTGRLSESSDPRDYKNRIARMQAVFPQVKDIPLENYWSGQVALTVDHLPHVHELAPGVQTGLGFNGRGVAMATLMGKILADRCRDDKKNESVFPISNASALPLHALRKPVVQSVVLWKKLMDRLQP